MTALIAQAPDSIWPSVIQAMSSNGFWVFVAICVLAGTAKHIVQLVLKHRERVAMIEAGMRPDHGGDSLPDEDDGVLKKTVHFENRPKSSAG